MHNFLQSLYLGNYRYRDNFVVHFQDTGFRIIAKP